MNDTIRMYINLETCNKIVSSMNDLGFEVLEMQGVLLDNYFIEIDKTIRLFNYKPRKYLMINAIYRNSWSSDLELVLTDCEETANEWLAHYDDYIKECEEY